MTNHQGVIPLSYMSGILLTLVAFTVFIVPVFPPATLHYLYPTCFTGIFLIAAMSIQKHRKYTTAAAITLIAIVWVSLFAKIPALTIIARIIQFLFFFFLVGRLVIQIAKTRTVTGKVIIDSIIGYLLMGLAFSTIVILVSFVSPGAYNFHTLDLSDSKKYAPLSDYFYYTFITYTTTGYGDFLPQAPLSKSLAMLIGVSGQLYVAVIIAMLVGKYATT